MNEFIQYNLDSAFTKAYFIDYLSHGYTLSRESLSHINFLDGEFFTILPKDISVENLYKFKSGGILPQLSKMEISEFKNFYPTPTIDEELCSFIIKFLENGNRTVIFDDMNARPKDPHLGVDGALMAIYKDEIHYVLQNTIPPDDVVKECIDSSNCVWHYLSILSMDVPMIKSEMTIYDFENIYKNAFYIIIGAYDREGYLFWKRKK